MKKQITVLFLFLAIVSTTFADSFTDAIQDLAFRTACIGKYSMRQAGLSGTATNYYTEEMIESRLAQESGNMTRTATFYGVCFDYAQFAYNYVDRYLGYYKSKGLYESQFWIAGTDENPNSIDLQYPGDKNNYTVIQNGVYMKRPANNPFRTVKTHRLNNQGERATYHAWIWIERADGVQFWVDPTWTDNLGYVVYGYVSQSGEEIQCRPDKKYCIEYPNYLDSLPLPPSYGNTIPPSPTANSTNREETIKDAGTDWVTKILEKTFIDVDYSYMNTDWIAFMLSADVPVSALIDQKFDLNKIGFALEMPMLFDSIAGIVGLEYLHNLEDENNIHAGLFEFDFTQGYFVISHGSSVAV